VSQPFGEETEELLYRAQRAIKDAAETREITRRLVMEAKQRREAWA
jgi:hypothetical protein